MTAGTRLTPPPAGYHPTVWDPRIIMAMVHRYGEACRRDDHARAGALYSEIVRALAGHDEAPGPSTMEDPGVEEPAAA